MIQFKFDAKDLKEFQDALVHGEAIAAQGLWRGTGASLGAMRREFLKETRVRIGKQPKHQYRGSNPNPKSRSRSSIVFRWDRFPKKEKDARRTRDVRGSYFTTSTAAESLEDGRNISPKAGKWLAIPMLKEGRDNTAAKRKDTGRLQPKGNWRTLRKFREKFDGKYEWDIENHGSYRIVYVRRRYKQKKRASQAQWFPAFLMKRSVKMPDRLDFYEFYERFKPEIEMRFKRELRGIVSDIIKRSRRRR